MRHYAWYSPEINVIVFQAILEDCYIVFEWDHLDICTHLNLKGEFKEMEDYLWIPLGEL